MQLPSDNTIEGYGANAQTPSNIKINGTKNHISIGSESKIDDVVFRVRGNGNSIIIGSGCILLGKIDIRGDGHRIVIGDKTTWQGVSIYAKEGCGVTIGEDCMFSKRVEIRTSDSHAILKRGTRERLNPAAAVVIGNHVWIGMDCIISKGTHIGNDVVVAAKSFVNKQFEATNVILGGVPAAVLRTDIDWDRRLSPDQSAPADK